MPTSDAERAIPQDLKHVRIVAHPAPILREKCAPITVFDPQLDAFAQHMLMLMKESEGVGLAAPQVSVLVRLFVCNTTGQPDGDRVFVNPTLTELTGAADAEEGCLSLPAIQVTMRRATRAVIEACDTTGRPIREIGEGLAARVWQHENDHLDGRMIIDRMSEADEIANRRALKQLEADYGSQSPPR